MAAKLRYFRPGEFLFREGEQAKCLYILKKGSVAIRKRCPGGYLELGKAYSNEVIGELAFFDRQPRSAAAIAISEVEAMEIDYSALDKIYHSVPDYFKSMMASVAERLRRADDMIRRLKKTADIDVAGDESVLNAHTSESEDHLDINDVLAVTSDVSQTVASGVEETPSPDSEEDLEKQIMAEIEGEAKKK